MNERTIGQIALPMGGQLRLQQLEFGTGVPVLSIISGLHGDEYVGLEVGARLAQFLTQVEAQGTPYQLKGRIRLLPAANALALITGDHMWPPDRTDLNRMFPGYMAGEVPQRLAHIIFEAIKSSRLCVDLHSGGMLAEWPQVRAFQDRDFALQASQKMGIPLVWARSGKEPHYNQDLEITSTGQGTLALALKQQGVENLILVGGQSNQPNRVVATCFYEALIRLAAHLGILHGPPLAPLPVQCVAQVTRVLATQPGLWLPQVELGTKVSLQQCLGHVVDPIQGHVLQELYAPVAAQVMSLRHQPLVHRGALLSRLAVLEES